MKKVSLPDLPKGKEFEEYISAYFQSAGYYIERNIIDRQVEEVLELDIIVTEYNEKQVPKLSLVEVKGGGWGFPDVFKIRGWLDYLNMSIGYLIVKQDKDSSGFYGSISNELSIKLITIPDLKETKNRLSEVLNGADILPNDIACWRFSYWTERQLLKILTGKKKSVQNKKCYQSIDTYFSVLNNRAFFTRNIIDRAIKLYETFKEYPNISSRMAHELQGENFDDQHDTVPKDIYDKTYYKCELTDLAISSFIEHRARLAILKSAIDYRLQKDAGCDCNEIKCLKFNGINFEYSLLELLPQSFQNGLEEISKHKYFHRYPIFWQWFLWVFGGFILKDYESHEFSLLSNKTGIPVDEIPNAFMSYQVLFPRDDGWFLDLEPNSSIRIMKMFPVPYMGIGANYRRWAYIKGDDLSKLKVTGQYTLTDLAKWNDVLLSLLSKK